MYSPCIIFFCWTQKRILQYFSKRVKSVKGGGGNGSGDVFYSRNWAFYTATWQRECKCLLKTSFSNMRYLSCVHRPIFYACPHHTTKQVKRFEVKNIEIIKWQGQSPDLSPIENLWWQCYGYKTHYIYQTMKETGRRVDQAVWKTSDVLCCRCVDVIQSKGLYNSYEFLTALTLQNVSCNLLLCYTMVISSFDHCTFHKMKVFLMPWSFCQLCK